MINEFRITPKYFLFWGSIFSQWYKISFKDFNGTKFSSAEQFMFYHKALLFNDLDSVKLIMLTNIPREQKELGRKVKNFNEDIWIEYREKIVFLASFYKFNQNLNLKKELLFFMDKTFVEASPKDIIWGIGLHYNDEKAEDQKQWKGMNLLGRQLNLVALDIKNNSLKLMRTYEKDLYNLT